MVDLYHSGHISLDFVGSRLWFFDESHELLISPWAVAVQAQAPFGAEFHDETVETLVQDQLLGENDSLIRYCWSNQKFCSTTSCHLVAIHGYPKVFNTLTLWLGRLQTTLGIEPLSPVFDKWLRISRSWSLTAKKNIHITIDSPLIHHYVFFEKKCQKSQPPTSRPSSEGLENAWRERAAPHTWRCGYTILVPMKWLSVII